VRKHAGATQAEVWIGRDGTNRLVRIRDDGAGFEPSENGAGQGLKNMKTRAASIGGVFGFISAPGRGTAVEVVLRA
jgi:signal transduction histidine kinase